MWRAEQIGALIVMWALIVVIWQDLMIYAVHWLIPCVSYGVIPVSLIDVGSTVNRENRKVRLSERLRRLLNLRLLTSATRLRVDPFLSYSPASILKSAVLQQYLNELCKSSEFQTACCVIVA